MKLKDLLFVNTSTHYVVRLKEYEELEIEEVDESEVPEEIKVALGIEVKDDKRPET